jgi:Ca2+-binding RTX toxin-like protein
MKIPSSSNLQIGSSMAGGEVSTPKTDGAGEKGKAIKVPEGQEKTSGGEKPPATSEGGSRRPVMALEERMMQKSLSDKISTKSQNRSERTKPSVGRRVAQADNQAKKTPSFTIKNEGPRKVIEGTSKDDVIKIDQNKNGDLVVSDSQGRSVIIPKDELKYGLAVRTGDGSDQIIATERVTHKLVLDGGAGDDTIQGGSGQDEIFGGGGKNVLSGGAGDDYIEGGNQVDTIDGGTGNDVIYGMGGDDNLKGGDDRDYIDGGKGNDRIAGDKGDDMLIGGKGNDTLEGGEGKDVLAGSSGRDTIDGGADADQIYRQADDTAKLNATDGDREDIVKIDPNAGKSITINGNQRFKDRVNSDLEAWRSLPQAGDLLTELDNRRAKSGQKVTIAEADKFLGSEARSENNDAMRNPDHTRGKGSNVEIKYNTTDRHLGVNKPWNFSPPSVIAYHEMSHTHDMVHGNVPVESIKDGIGHTGDEKNDERKATGLPFDHDGNPKTPLEQPGPYTENLIRRKLGLPTRDEYKTGK